MSVENKFNHLPNLSSHILGAKIVYATDEWFAAGECQLRYVLMINNKRCNSIICFIQLRIC